MGVCVCLTQSLCSTFRMDSVAHFLASPSVWTVAQQKMISLRQDTAGSSNSESKSTVIAMIGVVRRAIEDELIRDYQLLVLLKLHVHVDVLQCFVQVRSSKATSGMENPCAPHPLNKSLEHVDVQNGKIFRCPTPIPMYLWINSNHMKVHTCTRCFCLVVRAILRGCL